jgi:hypothetical protein
VCLGKLRSVTSFFLVLIWHHLPLFRFHNGHNFIVNHLLAENEVVLLLIPQFHFEKEVVFPRNMEIADRIQVISGLFRDQSKHVGVGIAHQVLFLKLQKQLQSLFPSAKVTFGMGNDTFEVFIEVSRHFDSLTFSA